ncbi:hypothetical protein [Oryzicola mucosus]|uniref:Uncharacterized protein n=1 Tax=Oryzicola mucosus TaxID=2767425 RepID=A0A8J6PEJ8_9HYPH|nr:hypothetical protein [Oryzicola mucosus]MBD0413419.1 hypothetical protein [Oryzicola mucosus]
MSVRKQFDRIGDFFTTVSSAVSAANAVSRGVQPKARHLRNLGIDPQQFNKIGRV